MKRKITYLLFVVAVLFASCQDEDWRNNSGQEGITVNLKSALPQLSQEELTQLVKPLHVMIFNENQELLQYKKYDGLSNIAPIQLSKGKYQIAYLSNVEQSSITGLRAGELLQDISVSLPQLDGKVANASDIFSGCDTLEVGMDKQSDAALKRLVGRLDIDVKGLSAAMNLKSITLFGSPMKVKLNGEGVGGLVPLDIAVKKDTAGVYKGTAVTFPTSPDSIAILEFVVERNGKTEIFRKSLENKVEANLIHAIHVSADLSDNWIVDVQTMPWGATRSEDVEFNMSCYNTVKLVFPESITLTDSMGLGRPQELSILLMDKLNNRFYINQLKTGDTPIQVVSDTVIFDLNRPSVLPIGELKIMNVEIKCKDYDVFDYIYKLHENFPITLLGNGDELVIDLPEMGAIAASDMQAMYDLRDALIPFGSKVTDAWLKAGDQIELWPYVQLNGAGRVVSIDMHTYGYRPDLDDSIPQTKSMATRSARIYGWNLPESFKNLTELKAFDLAQFPLAELPAYIKDFSKMESLNLNTSATAIPELPNLRFLRIEATNLKELPAFIGNMSNLENFYVSSSFAINTVNVDFSKLKNLKTIALSASQDCSFPASLWSCNQLETIDLSGFTNVEVPAEIRNFKELYSFALAYDSCEASALKELQHAPSLRSLRIYACPNFCKDGFPLWITDMPVKYLDLEYCGLTSLPDEMDKMTGLESMSAYGNPDLAGKLPAGLYEKYIKNEFNFRWDGDSFSPDGIILKVTPMRIETQRKDTVQCSISIIATGKWRINNSFRDALFFDKMEGEGNAEVQITLMPKSYLDNYGFVVELPKEMSPSLSRLVEIILKNE